MAKYTIELKDVVANHNIFDFKYPFYDESKRLEFEEKFIRHFYFREIGCDTVDRFKMYLHDKMLTVFPYYNKLLETSLIEYEITDNYKLTETYTRTVEDKQKQSTVSSSVGRLTDEQETHGRTTTEVETEGNASTSGTETQTETTESKTDANGTTNVETSETVDNDTTTKNTTATTVDDKITEKVIAKHHDTPQGLVSLSDSKYLTDLKQNDTTNNKTSAVNETTSGSGTNDTTTTGTSDTTTTDHSETDGTRNLTIENLSGTTTEGKETTTSDTEGMTTQEQKATQDNNTRTMTDADKNESYTLVRKGNIGVDTDSDVILKHLKLQKVLTQIELMFFDECEDLFMQVY